MADDLITPTLKVDGLPLSVTSFSQATDGQVTVLFESPSPAFQDPWDAAQMVTAVDKQIESASSLPIDDLTTDVAYTYQIKPGSESESYQPYTGTIDLTFISTSNTCADIDETAPCFTQGTLIDTPFGSCAVEDLVEHSKVSLATGGTARASWIGRRRVSDARVIRFRPHALGDNQPRRDLCVSHDHAVLVADVLVPAGLLVNGETIVEERWPTVTFYHVELDDHAILLAEGAPAESYLDTGNRRQFGNCPLSYDAETPGGEPCKAMAVAGDLLERARASVRLTA